MYSHVDLMQKSDIGSQYVMTCTSMGDRVPDVGL